ncbi:MAG: 50S ribosomal protein L22 [Chitinophagales bacterium]|nr:50S ribosomal protein L22 [Chitinophagales bacterium]
MEAVAKLNNCPTSPRKMRLVADIIRGKEVNEALNILKFSKKEPAVKLHKLLLSAVNNWEQKSGDSADSVNLFVKTIMVNEGKMLKRFQPAPQGRAYRIRKRSNHVSIILDNKNS